MDTATDSGAEQDEQCDINWLNNQLGRSLDWWLYGWDGDLCCGEDKPADNVGVVEIGKWWETAASILSCTIVETSSGVICWCVENESLSNDVKIYFITI